MKYHSLLTCQPRWLSLFNETGKSFGDVCAHSIQHSCCAVLGGELLVCVHTHTDIHIYIYICISNVQPVFEIPPTSTSGQFMGRQWKVIIRIN